MTGTGTHRKRNTMKIVIHSVPQENIRSNQSGDWWVHGNAQCTVHVLDTLSLHSQLAVAIHELIEGFLCREHLVTDEMVCRFDDQYEAEREQGKHKDEDEPGDDPAAPYRQEHMAATHVERAVCHALGLSWADHEQAISGHQQFDPGKEVENQQKAVLGIPPDEPLPQRQSDASSSSQYCNPLSPDNTVLPS